MSPARDHISASHAQDRRLMHKIGVSTARSPELLSAPSKANNNNSRAITMREISHRAPRHTSRPVEIGAQLPTSI